MNELFMVRYCNPTKYDIAPFGTVCKVMQDEKAADYYIQLSHDTDKSRWEKMGYLFESAFNRFYDDKEFIEATLKLFKEKDPAALSTVMSKLDKTAY